MPPADNSKFVLTNVMVRTALVAVGGFVLAFIGFYLEDADVKKAVLHALMAALAAGGVPRFAEGVSLDFLRSTKLRPPVSPGDVGATSPPITLPK